jgi:hypothetical protein
VREAKLHGVTEVSALMLTHYTTRTPGSLHLLLGQETVRALYLPQPLDGEDYYLMLSCMEKAALYGVPAHLYENGEDVSATDLCIRVNTAYVARSARPIHTVEITASEQSLLYCGASFSESHLLPAVMQKAGDCEVLIFGNQGPNIKSSYGTDLPVRDGVTVVLADAPTAAWLKADAWTRCVDLRMGPWRGKLIK